MPALGEVSVEKTSGIATHENIPVDMTDKLHEAGRNKILWSSVIRDDNILRFQVLGMCQSRNPARNGHNNTSAN